MVVGIIWKNDSPRPNVERGKADLERGCRFSVLPDIDWIEKSMEGHKIRADLGRGGGVACD